MPVHLQREIESLKKKLLSVGSLVEENLWRAVKSIADRDVELAEQAAQADLEIDALEVEVEEDCLKVLALHQNFPNPFNPSTTIRFELPVDARVRLDVFRLDGGRVARLADAVMPAGRHGIVWRGLDDRGAPVASGVYFYRLETGDARMVRRMTLLR